MKTELLHSCCAPCSSAILEWMLAHDVKPVLFYCNPNIYPANEYAIRKNELTRYATSLGLEVIDDDYDHEAWLDFIKGTNNANGCKVYANGIENEPERGARCLECFRYRLLRTARKCKELGIESFTTTLASSRWKSLEQINKAGYEAAEAVNSEYTEETAPAVTFDDHNWRKGGLQERRNALLKQNGFYNQLYCGCEFSLQANADKIVAALNH